MKKVLIVATVVKKHIMQFHLPTLEMFKSIGWETHVAGGNDYDIPSDCNIPHCDVYHQIDFERFPFHPKNIKAYKELKKIIDASEYDLIHCHTPVGSILTRLAARSARKKGTKVFYTAHGLHFYKGAPILNWLLYYPVEKLCSYFTDCIITMNAEDYNLAKRKFKTKVEFVNGVGVDIGAMQKTDKETSLRDKLGLKCDDIILLSVGELIKRKNHKTILKAISKIKSKNIRCLIAGEGREHEKLEKMVKDLKIEENVRFLGYRTDVYECMKMSDIFCFSSYQEGLSLALMEAMAAGLPVLASRIRGNIDLIDEEKGGFLYAPDDADGFAEGIDILVNNPQLAEKMAKYNQQKIKKYDVNAVMEKLKMIYDKNGVEL